MKATPVVVLYGPTAVGKTSLLSSLAEYPIEIINADSRQVYRYLDIGTAKPSPDILEAVPHHCIDVRVPSAQYTVGDFVRAAERLVTEIRGRDRFPVVSGGTGYYIKHFLFGLPEGPGGFPGIRAEIRRETQSRGMGEMYRELEFVDPDTARRISSSDRYRIERALEVYRGAGVPLSTFRLPDRIRDDYRLFIVSCTRPKEELYSRIDARVDSMFESGLVAETVGVLARGFSSRDPGLKTIGYAEILAARADGCRTLAETRDLIKRHTRRFAKRQTTFFKSLPAERTISPDLFGSIVEAIRAHFFL